MTEPTGMDPGAQFSTGMDQLDPAPLSPDEPPPAPPGAAEASVTDFLATLPESLQADPVAVSAVWLARQLDNGNMPGREGVGCVRELRMCMTQLREWNPAGEAGDGTDAARDQMENVRALYVVAE